MRDKNNLSHIDAKVKIASKERLEQLRQDGLKKLKEPVIREVFMRLKDK